MKSWRDVLPIHPAANLFPLMSPDELRALGEDIKRNGFTSPIVLWRADAGSPPALLDGRNRLDAAEQAGLLDFDDRGRPCLKGCHGLQETPRQYVGSDPYALAVSFNIHRRHLTPEQKRDLIAKLIKAQPDKSALQISKMAKSSPHTVIKVRDDLVAKGDVCKVQTSTDTTGRKQPVRKERRTEDDFMREVRAKKAATIATAMPGTIISRTACPGGVSSGSIADDVCRAVVDCVADVITRVSNTLAMSMDAEQREILFGSLHQAIADLERDGSGAEQPDPFDIPDYLDRRGLTS